MLGSRGDALPPLPVWGKDGSGGSKENNAESSTTQSTTTALDQLSNEQKQQISSLLLTPVVTHTRHACTLTYICTSTRVYTHVHTHTRIQATRQLFLSTANQTGHQQTNHVSQCFLLRIENRSVQTCSFFQTKSLNIFDRS